MMVLEPFQRDPVGSPMQAHICLLAVVAFLDTSLEWGCAVSDVLSCFANGVNGHQGRASRWLLSPPLFCPLTGRWMFGLFSLFDCFE